MHLRLAVMALLFLLRFAAPASAQLFIATGRDTLRGLPGVEVLVEDVPPELPQSELTMTAVRAAVEQRLRSGGIPVYPTQAINASAAKAYVYVHLTAVALPGRSHAVSIEVHLRQTVQSIATPSNIVNAMTWEHHTLAIATDAEGGALRALILEMVDDFVADWRAVH